jgi:ribonuclease P protein component
VQRKFRLTRSEDFKRVRRSGRSYAHPLVVLVVQRNELEHLRVGVAAGRTTGTAVHRNRAKRLLREAMRTLIPNIAPDTDLILIARSGLTSATLADTRQALLNLLQRAQLLTSPAHES